MPKSIQYCIDNKIKYELLPLQQFFAFSQSFIVEYVPIPKTGTTQVQPFEVCSQLYPCPCSFILLSNLCNCSSLTTIFCFASLVKVFLLLLVIPSCSDKSLFLNFIIYYISSNEAPVGVIRNSINMNSSALVGLM